MTLSAKIEAILFHKAEPINYKDLAKMAGVKPGEISTALDELETALSGRGLTLIRTNDEVSMGTSPDASHTIEALIKEELSKDLGKAGLETLTIILYKGRTSKKEVDYIRGVNSAFIIRNLLIRGLILRDENKGERGYIYEPSIELLSYLGLKKIAELPDYEEIHKELDNFLSKPQDEEIKEENE